MGFIERHGKFSYVYMLSPVGYIQYISVVLIFLCLPKSLYLMFVFHTFNLRDIVEDYVCDAILFIYFVLALLMEGIYRLSGSQVVIKKLIVLFNQGW